MSNFLISFNAVFPLFCMMALGYFLRAIKIFDVNFLRQLNSLCFKVFLPLLLFVNVYNSDFSTQFSGKLLLFAVSALLVAYIIFLALTVLLCKNNKRRGVLVQAMIRSNFILFGIPISSALFGESGGSAAAVLIAFVVPLYNVISVIALSIFGEEKFNLSKTIKGVVTNPLIIGAAVAFLFVITGLRLPSIVYGTAETISRVATPLALIVLGGGFCFSGIKKNWLPIVVASSVKLIVLPLAILPIAMLFNFDMVSLVVLYSMLASPIAVSSYTMAQSMGADDELAGQLVVVTSSASVLTIFVGVMLLTSILGLTI